MKILLYHSVLFDLCAPCDTLEESCQRGLPANSDLCEYYDNNNNPESSSFRQLSGLYFVS